jgi:hypothetical protein
MVWHVEGSGEHRKDFRRRGTVLGKTGVYSRCAVWFRRTRRDVRPVYIQIRSTRQGRDLSVRHLRQGGEWTMHVLAVHGRHLRDRSLIPQRRELDVPKQSERRSGHDLTRLILSDIVKSLLAHWNRGIPGRDRRVRSHGRPQASASPPQDCGPWFLFSIGKVRKEGRYHLCCVTCLLPKWTIRRS